jgi:hypothetical protein
LDEESQKCQFNPRQWLCTCKCTHFAEAAKSRRKPVQLLEKSVINIIRLVSPVFDWPNIMIGGGGLLLVAYTYLQSQFQFYG